MGLGDIHKENKLWNFFTEEEAIEDLSVYIFIPIADKGSYPHPQKAYRYNTELQYTT